MSKLEPFTVHIVQYDYARPYSAAYPRAEYLVKELCQARKRRVVVWAASDKANASGVTGSYGEKMEIVVDPLQWLKRELMENRKKRLDNPTGLVPPPEEKSLLRSVAAAAKSNVLFKFLYPDPSKGWRDTALWKLGNRLLFPDGTVVWSRFVLRRMKRRVAPGDVVVTFSPPESVCLVGEACKKMGLRWRLDFADGWTWQGLRELDKAEPARMEKEKALEKRLVGLADGVSTVTVTLKNYFDTLRPSPDVFLYPNIIPMALSGSHDRYWPNVIRRTGKFTALYFGRLSKSHRGCVLEPLLAQLSTHDGSSPKPEFIFQGDYNDGDLAEIARISKLGFNVEVGAMINRSDLPEFMAKRGVNAMLVVLAPGCMASTSKLFDAFAVGAPVWLFADSQAEASKIVMGERAGALIPNGSPPPPLSATVAELMGKWRDAETRPASAGLWGYEYATKLADGLETLAGDV